MQTQFSTANPELASLLETGYRMDTTPTDPIDPPDNQGGGGTTTTQPQPEEEEPAPPPPGS